MKVLTALGLLVSIALCGCVSKATMQARERAAFLAGQRQAQATQNQGPTVIVVGPVKYHMISWTQDLTVAHAIIQAEYFGPGDPKNLLVIRKGVQIPIDPQDLLTGKDFPLGPGDILEIQP